MRKTKPGSKPQPRQGGEPQITAQAARKALLEEQQARYRRVAAVMLEAEVAPTGRWIIDAIQGQAFVPGLALFEELSPPLREQIRRTLAQWAGDTGEPTHEEADE